jgi:beta-galactosidase
MEWEDARFTGFVNGKPVVELHMVADPLPTTLEVEADSLTLRATERDTTRVIIRALDQAGTRLPFLNDITTVEVSGPAKLIGPETMAFQGGTTGFWLQTTGEAGVITVKVSSARFASRTVTLAAE